MSRIDTHMNRPDMVLIRYRKDAPHKREYLVPTGKTCGYWVSIECADCRIDGNLLDTYAKHAISPGGNLYEPGWIIRGDYRWEDETL